MPKAPIERSRAFTYAQKITQGKTRVNSRWLHDELEEKYKTTGFTAFKIAAILKRLGFERIDSRNYERKDKIIGQHLQKV